MTIPHNGYQAFQQGFLRNRNPFDWSSQFNAWLLWDQEWELAKWI